MKRLLQTLFLLLALLCCCGARAAALPEGIRPFLKKHCFKCHGPEKQKSGLRLDTLTGNFNDSPTAATWIKVRDRLNLGEMPPNKEPRPDLSGMLQVTHWIADELKQLDARAASTGGRVLLRRLTRTEYANTVRDLLKIGFDDGRTPIDLLPPDGSIEGFDKLSKALLLDPSLMNEYLEVAEFVADRAIRTHPDPIPRMTDRFEVEHPSNTTPTLGHRKIRYLEDGIFLYHSNFYPGGDLAHPCSLKKWKTLNAPKIPVRGRYTIRIRAGADRGNRPNEPIFLDVHRVKTEKKRFRINAPIGAPKVYEWTAVFNPDVRGGINLVFANGTEMWRRSKANGSVRFLSRRLVEQGKRGEALRLRARGRAEGFYEPGGDIRYAPTEAGRDLTVLPRIFIDWIELEGPITEPFPPASTRYLLPDGDATDVRRIFAHLLPRAFRRPVEEDEINRFTELVGSEIGLGHPLTEALKTGLIAVLSSPDFLHRVEGPAAELNDHQLATRLSYFLWSSMPDDELFALANAGKLSSPETLRRQTGRMLSGPKAEALVNDFARQWLKVPEFDAFIPDAKIYRDSYYATEFDGIGKLLKAEALAFFREILTHNESVRNFLDSDWIMANETLASYYEIPGVRGDEFRRVPLPANSPRGGLLGLGGIHRLGSDGNRTKPVARGKYLLTVLFNDPPNPPPPNAGEVQPNVRGQNLSVRERLLQHQTVETCANCHRTIDPYGLALENWNAVGLWRDRQDGEKPPRQWGNRAPRIINQGALPNGDRYRNYTEFKAALKKQTQRFERALAEKLFIYALGRTLEPTDDAAIQRLVTNMPNHGHTLKGLIHDIVQTKAFRTK